MTTPEPPAASDELRPSAETMAAIAAKLDASERCPHCEQMGLNVEGEPASAEHCDDCDGKGYLTPEPPAASERMTEQRWNLLLKINTERWRQDQKWGTEHDAGHSDDDWREIIRRLCHEAWAEPTEANIIKIAATAVAWVEAP